MYTALVLAAFVGQTVTPPVRVGPVEFKFAAVKTDKSWTTFTGTARNMSDKPSPLGIKTVPVSDGRTKLEAYLVAPTVKTKGKTIKGGESVPIEFRLRVPADAARLVFEFGGGTWSFDRKDFAR